ncbi:thioredoxin domain-containing protein [Sandarakinorhabdus rubra]|uniref:thioredoxin domain-containing protein n=1 Tax=Sandarakinorhabdus rubra TaxID=2672568 RepID=UPI0013DC413E|nr:thioredoxin domain-containing protein [Sandarakinorhabdus rubra]
MRPAAAITAALVFAAIATPLAAQPARAPAAATSDWSTRVATTPAGGILLGNPNAPVKLVEFGSLTCPHCRAFHEAALPALKSRYLAAGRVSYEYRPFTLNGIDLMAGLLVQCQPAPGAWGFVNRVYERQDELVAPFMQVSEADRAGIAALPADQQGPKMAELGKLPTFAAAAGLPRARYDACLAAKPGMDKLLAIRADAVQIHGLTGTPSFLINGKMQADTYDWAALEPLLAAAVKAAPTAARTK